MNRPEHDPAVAPCAEGVTLRAAATTHGDTTGPGAAVRLRLEPGATPLPDYTLVSFLGRGGFGEVWKALGPGGFAVALKFIALGAQAGAAEERAAELLKTKDVRHANLLGLFGAWRRGDVLILAMELADGTVADRLTEAVAQGSPGVPFGELLEYMREAAKGLDHLHAVGVHHRDVKPQNLLLVGGSVKVADFGLAKVLEQASAPHTGAMTPAYAAPEFLAGRLSAHSDQYALAVAYCQLRGGRLPFGGGPAQVMFGHLTESPDLTMLPEAEQPAVARALAKDPHARWPGCRDFVEAVAAADGDASPAARPNRRAARTTPHLPAPERLPPAEPAPIGRTAGAAVRGFKAKAWRPRRRWPAWTFAVALLLSVAAAAGAFLWINRPTTPPDQPAPHVERVSAYFDAAGQPRVEASGPSFAPDEPLPPPPVQATQPMKPSVPPGATADHPPAVAPGDPPPVVVPPPVAEPLPPPPREITTAGLFVGVDKEVLTVRVDDEEKTFPVRATTSVRIDGTEGRMSDIQEESSVAVTSRGDAVVAVEVKSPPPARAALRRGKRLLDEHDYDAAIDALAEAERLAPSDPLPRAYRARAYFDRSWRKSNRSEDNKEALREAEEAVRLAPASALAHAVRGLARAANDDADAGLVDAEEAVRLDPKLPDAYYTRGWVYAEKEENDKDISDCNAALRLDPNYALALIERGLAWYSKKEFDKAIADYDEAIRLDPKNANTFNRRGVAWYSKKEYDKAITDYSEAIRLDPKYAVALYNRGDACQAKGAFDKAIADCDEAIRLDPKYARAFNSRGVAYKAIGDQAHADADFAEYKRLTGGK